MAPGTNEDAGNGAEAAISDDASASAAAAAEDERRAVEFAKCHADVAYFTHHFLEIDDAQGHGDGGGTMPFHLWPAQTNVLWQFLTSRLVLILKARQLGISWLCCAYALWLCLFQDGKVVMLFSKGKAEANELLRRVKVLYERLPDWMRDALPQLDTSNTTTLGWTNGSRVQSNPATQSAGRSFTASLVILDEAAFLQWASTLYTSMKPVIDGGGQLIVLSTANGIGNLFHQLWTKASAKLNKFNAIFLPWWSRPGRTLEWYNEVFKEAADPALVPQEYPASANEAFVSTGRTRFPMAWLEAQTKRLRDFLADAEVPVVAQAVPGLVLFEKPTPGARYVIGADVAEGLEHGDYSAAVLINVDTAQVAGVLHGHWEPGTYANYLAALGTAYNAEIAVERNNHGHAVLLSLELSLYPRVVCGPDERPGWLSNTFTKPLIIDGLAASLRDNEFAVAAQPILDELQIYQVLKNGKTGAPKNYHDDLVMALAIALHIAKFPPGNAAQDEEIDDDEYRANISSY